MRSTLSSLELSWERNRNSEQAQKTADSALARQTTDHEQRKVTETSSTNKHVDYGKWSDLGAKTTIHERDLK